jgi:radical SAM superfamily enzyme YgiQ (UPF0313 family)
MERIEMNNVQEIKSKGASKRKVLLFLSNSRWGGKRPWMIVPYCTLILTTLLKKDYSFAILDANGPDLSDEECVSRMKKQNPEIILLTGSSSEYHNQTEHAAKLAKQACPKSTVILGGVYPTVLGEEAIKDKNIDFIFIGHAEERINQFLELVISGNKEEIRKFPGIGFRDESGSAQINPLTTTIADIKVMYKPDYSLVDLKPYLIRKIKDYQFNSHLRSVPIITSFGCPHNCIFCASRTITGRRMSYRPLEDILEEIDYLVKQYDVQELLFLDDSLMLKKDRFESLLNSLINRGYNLKWKTINAALWNMDDDMLKLIKKSGCTQMTVSIESGSQRVLNEIIKKPLKLEIVAPTVKKIKELGIDIGGNFVIGFPGETWDELRETFRFAEKCDFDLAHFHVATPLPKTDLYYLAKEKGLLPPDFSFMDEKYFGFAHAFIKTDEFTPQELMTIRAYEWDRINFSTPEKCVKVASMYDITLEELQKHRKQTRLNCGIHF